MVTALGVGGPAALRPLYRLLDRAAAGLGRLLGLRYGRVVVLRGERATLAAAAAAAARAAAGVEALDVLLNVHGQPDGLTLAGGAVGVAALASALGGAAPGRLRLLYSTACHAAAHAAAMRAAGFRACLGARRINASGAVETPTFLLLWSLGVPVRAAIRAADHPAVRRPADALARLALRALGERGAVDSAKVLDGEGGLTIRS